LSTSVAFAVNVTSVALGQFDEVDGGGHARVSVLSDVVTALITGGAFGGFGGVLALRLPTQN
jgi:hypothetical protein